MADPNQLKLVKQHGHKQILFCAARQPDSRRLYAGAGDGGIYTFDLDADPTEQTVWRGHAGYVTGVTLAGGRLISAAYDGRLCWWDTDSGETVRDIEAHQRWIRHITATPDQQQVISVGDDMVCRVWDAESGSLLHELRGHAPRTPHHFPSMLFTCAVSADGRLLATADKVGHIVVWELASGKSLATLDAPLMYTWDPKQRIHSIGGIRSLAFSHDGTLLAAGGIGQIGNIDHLGALARVEVFDWQQQQRTHEFKGDTHKGLVERLVFHPERAWLLAVGGDHGGFIQFLDLDQTKVIKQDKAPMHVHDLLSNAAHTQFIGVGHQKIVEWELRAE